MLACVKIINMMRKNDIDPKGLMAVERASTALLGAVISLIVLGFVIEKFELFLHLITFELSDNSDKVPQLSHVVFYKYLSILVVIAGILLALFTCKYYTSWIKHLKNQEVSTDKSIFFILSVFIIDIGLVLMVSMLFV